MKKIKLSIIGGGGYVGGELLRFLLFHPKAEIVAITTKGNEGRLISEVHQNLKGLTNLKFTDKPIEEIAEISDVIFFATPHGVAMKEVPKIIKSNIKIIDLSADFRLKDLEEFEKYYGKHACPELIKKFVYGLTEFNRAEIKKTNYISCPGCFPTGALLALIPLAKENLLDKVVIDSKTGSSGSGSQPSFTTHHPERTNDFSAYEILTHRHFPEIYQEMKRFSQEDFDLCFVPHSAPFVRGIFTTCYIFTDRILNKESLSKVFKKYYDKEYFIRIVDNSPRCGVVAGTNFCNIGFACEKNKIVIVSAIDNLVKGAAGQAIQNMNLTFGLDEKMGLEFPGTHP